MNIIQRKKLTPYLNLTQLKHLKFDYRHEKYIASLIDVSGYVILKGYGETMMDALNDLHHNLL